MACFSYRLTLCPAQLIKKHLVLIDTLYYRSFRIQYSNFNVSNNVKLPDGLSFENNDKAYKNTFLSYQYIHFQTTQGYSCYGNEKVTDKKCSFVWTYVVPCNSY